MNYDGSLPDHLAAGMTMACLFGRAVDGGSRPASKGARRRTEGQSKTIPGQGKTTTIESCHRAIADDAAKRRNVFEFAGSPRPNNRVDKAENMPPTAMHHGG